MKIIYACTLKYSVEKGKEEINEDGEKSRRKIHNITIDLTVQITEMKNRDDYLTRKLNDNS